MKGFLQSQSQRPFVPPVGLLAELGLGHHQGGQNWLAATAAVDDLSFVWRDDPLASRQRNETECYQQTFGEAIEISFIREAVLAEVPKNAAVYSEVSSQLTDQFIAAELRRCNGKKADAVAALKSDVVHMVEAAVERHAASKDTASPAKKPVKFEAKMAPGMVALTTIENERIQARLNRLRALQLQDEWLAAMAEGGMRYTDDGLQIDLGEAKRSVTIPLNSIRFYDVKKVTNADGVEVYEIIMKTPAFAGGVWSMNEVREELSATSKWVQDNVGKSADDIAAKLMSMQQSSVLDFIKQAQAQVQGEIAQTTSKLTCGEACTSALGTLSSYVPSVNSRAFPKLPSAPSLMV